MKGHKHENDKKKDKSVKHDKEEKHDKDEKHDKRSHDKGSHDKGKHSKGSKHGHDKHKKELKLNPNQIELYKRCNAMLKIVTNQDKDKLYTYKSSDDQDEIVNLRQQMANCINTTKYNKNITDPGPSKPNSAGNCKIIISHETSIECARAMHKNGLIKIAVMSFASPHDQGGPYKKGILTQETSIISQTLLLGSLLSQAAKPFYISKKSHKDKGKDKDKSGHKNAMDSLNNGIIYSPSVPVIINDKGLLSNSKEVFYIDVISASPVKLLKKGSSSKNGHGSKDKHSGKNAKGSHNDQSLQEKVMPIMEKKIRDTIYVAASVKVDGIILGAFGCGPSGNDPKVISKIFEKILITDGYAGHFKQIVFSIPGKYTSKVFQNCFKKYLPKEDSTSQKKEEPTVEEKSNGEEESHGEEESQPNDSSYSEEESLKDSGKGKDDDNDHNDDDADNDDNNITEGEEEDIC